MAVRVRSRAALGAGLTLRGTPPLKIATHALVSLVWPSRTNTRRANRTSYNPDGVMIGFALFSPLGFWPEAWKRGTRDARWSTHTSRPSNSARSAWWLRGSWEHGFRARCTASQVALQIRRATGAKRIT